MEQLTLSDLPDWLTEHYEKEHGECWIFYLKGAEFTSEQIMELSKRKINFYRTSDCDRSGFRGDSIKVFKSQYDFDNSRYIYGPTENGIRVGKRR